MVMGYGYSDCVITVTSIHQQTVLLLYWSLHGEEMRVNFDQ